MFIETGLEEALEDMYSYSMQKIVDGFILLDS